LRGADSGYPNCIKSGADAGLPADACHEDKRSLRRSHAQDAGTVQIGGELCRCGDSGTDFGRRDLILEVRLGGDHLLVENARYKHFARLGKIKNDLLAMFKAAQTGTDRIAGPADGWIVSQKLKTVLQPLFVFNGLGSSPSLHGVANDGFEVRFSDPC